MCQERKKKALSILIIIAMVMTFEYVAQGVWVGYLSLKGEKEIAKCERIVGIEQRTECFKDYIHDRNKHAVIGVNGYLFTIVILLGASGISAIQRRRAKRGNTQC